MSYLQTVQFANVTYTVTIDRHLSYHFTFCCCVGCPSIGRKQLTEVVETRMLHGSGSGKISRAGDSRGTPVGLGLLFL